MSLCFFYYLFVVPLFRNDEGIILNFLPIVEVRLVSFMAHFAFLFSLFLYFVTSQLKTSGKMFNIGVA